MSSDRVIVVSMRALMTDRVNTSRPLEVWMDGHCGMCRASQAWCEARDTGKNLMFRDFRAIHDEQLPLSAAEHEASLWVRDTDGSLHRGFAAWRRIMRQLPGWRWLAAVTALPPLRWLGEPLYRLVARNRHRLPVSRT
jgi:predicted DCC family thiol-disulfide oxidoreductase YuxK